MGGVQHDARDVDEAGVVEPVQPESVLPDGTLAECDRVGDGRADYSHKHRRHGVNVQVVTDPGGRLV